MATYQDFDGAGTTSTFSLPFSSNYLNKSHVKLFYGRDRLANTQTATLTDGTDYNWTSATQVQLIYSTLNSGGTAGQPYNLPTGTKLTIERQTPGDTQLSAWSDGSNLTAEALNNADLQNLYVVQEQTDSNALGATKAIAADTAATTATTAANSATTAADAATTAADAATDAATAATSASTTASTNATNAKLATDRLVATTSDGGSTWTLAGNNTDASTDPKGVGYAVAQAESASSTASTASGNATTALNNSRESDGSGGYTSAISIANTAKDTADTASSAASTADATATSAEATATTASTNATNAKLATDRLVATTSDGGSTWTLTGNNTNASTDPKGVGYAVTQAEAAVTTANNASAAVSAAVLFDLVTNVSSIPASPSDGDYIEVANSTGIESFTPLASLPSGFTGAAGLTVRLNYTTSGTTWNYMSYFANDPEDRYIGPAGGTITNQRSLLFGEANANGSNTVGFKSPASVVSNVVWVLPAADGSDGQAIVSDGSGNLSFGDVAQPTIDGGNFATGGSLVSNSQTFDGKSFD